MFGQSGTDWERSAELKLVHSYNIVKTHLQLGYDVVLPFLLTKPEQAEEYKALAHECDADFYEFYLDLPHDEAIERLVQRGCWGEPGSAPFTAADMPRIEALYQKMEAATAHREHVIRLYPQPGKIEETYQDLLKQLG